MLEFKFLVASLDRSVYVGRAKRLFYYVSTPSTVVRLTPANTYAYLHTVVFSDFRRLGSSPGEEKKNSKYARVRLRVSVREQWPARSRIARRRPGTPPQPSLATASITITNNICDRVLLYPYHLTADTRLRPFSETVRRRHVVIIIVTCVASCIYNNNNNAYYYYESYITAAYNVAAYVRNV